MAKNALGSLTVGIAADASGFAADAKRDILAAKPEMEAAGDSLGQSIGTGLKAGFAAATAAIAVGGAVFAGLVASGVGLADALADSANQLGIASDSLLLFREAATGAGIDVELVNSSLAKMTAQIGAAVTGSASASAAFANIGLSAQALAEMSVEERFAAIAANIALIPNDAERAAAAIDIFGKSGAAILPLMGTLAESTSALKERWTELGAEITAEQINAAGGLADRVDMLGMVFDRFKILMAAEMVPYLQVVLDLIDDVVKSAGGIGPAASNVVGIFSDIAGVVLDVSQIVFGLGQTVLGVGKFFVALGKSIGQAFVSGAAATADFAAGLYRNIGGVYDWLGKTVTSIVQGIANGIGRAWTAVSNFIQRGFNVLIDAWNEVADVLGFGQMGRFEIETWEPIQMDALFSSGGDFDARAAEFEEAANDWRKSALGSDPDWDGVGQQFENSGKNLMAVLTDSGDRWSSQFAAKVEAARDELMQQTPQAQAQALPVNHASPFVLPGQRSLELPTQAARSIMPNGYQQPVTVNQQFATGVSAQDLNRAASQIKKETIQAVADQVRQGGNFRREVQC